MTNEKDGRPEDAQTESAGGTVATANVLSRGRVSMSPPGVATQPSSVSATSATLGGQRYTSVRRLGRGGMGEVWLCNDERIGRHVALKTLAKSANRGDPAWERFLREARIQGQLEHPAIVPVYDLDVSESGDPYFAMKRVGGRTLRQIIDGIRARDISIETQFTPHRLMSAFAQVALAVAYAHSRGVVHRDIKPDNLMIGDFGEVYVLDWGVAKIVGGLDAETTPGDAPAIGSGVDPVDLTRLGTRVGTPGYIPPERLAGTSTPIDVREELHDVYALGIILFEVVSRIAPFEGMTAEGRIEDAQQGVASRLGFLARGAGVAPELEQLVVRATARNPRDRIQSVRELHDSLERFLAQDRDVELRRVTARAHAKEAEELATSIDRGDRDDPEPRRRGLAAATRALALDPENVEATTSLLQILTTPPKSPPRESLEAYRLSQIQRFHAVTRLGAIGFAALLGYAPLLFAMGVRSIAGVGALLSMFGVFALVSVWLTKKRAPTDRDALALLALNAVAVGMSTAILGPFVIAPGFAAVNVVAFLLVLDRHRGVVVAIGIATFLVPLLLELTGVTPPRTSFDGDSMRVAAWIVGLPRGASMLLLTISSATTVLISSWIVIRLKRALREAELRLYVNAWQIEQLVPRGGEKGERRTSPEIS